MYGAGNPNLKFSTGAAPSNTAPFNSPTQGQMSAPGGGMDPMMVLSLLQSMQGGDKKNAPAALVNDGKTNPQDYQPGQFDVAKEPYGQAVLKAMKGRL